MGMVLWLWRDRAGYGGIWGDMEGGGEGHAAHDQFRSLGLILIGSYRWQRLRQVWGLRLF